MKLIAMGKKTTYSIKNWPEDERPRERIIRFGSASLSDAQLLAIILRIGDSSTGMSALDLARMLLEKAGDLTALEQWTAEELCSVRGLGNAKTAQIKAAIEIGKRVVAGGGRPAGKITGSSDVAVYYMPTYKHVKKESFRILLLASNNKIIREVVVSIGSLTASIVHPREVFNPALRDSAASIIMIHNHPSGDPAPSTEDVEITKRLSKCGEMLGIKVLDHVIIGDKTYYSFLDEGMI